MIEISEAIARALELFHVVFKDVAGDREIVDLLVEEVELADDERSWTVTIGYSHRGEVNSGTIGEALGQITPKLLRRYKAIRVDAETGQVRSLRTGTAKTL